MSRNNRAKLSTSNPKDYFVYFRDETGRLLKKRGKMNHIKSLRERKKFGLEMCDVINQNITQGRFKPQSVKMVLDEIVASRKDSLRRRSWQSYKYAADKFCTWLPDPEMTMNDITPPVARAFMDSLKYKGKTRNGIRGFLTALFNHYATRNEGYLNPFRGTTKSLEEAGRHTAFTPKQADQLWEAMDDQMRLFTRFIYFTYLRPLELLRLKVGDVRMDMGEIIIQGHQSKNKRQQSVVIPDIFLMEIKSMQYDQMPRDWYLFGKGLVPGPSPLSRNTVTKYHRTILDDVGLTKDYTLYSWKHTGVVAAYKAGIDLYSIMRQLRHHSLEMTQIYLKSLGLVRNEQFGRLMV